MFTITGNEAQRDSLMDHLCFIFGFVFIRCNSELRREPSKGVAQLRLLEIVFHGHGKKIIGFNRFSQSYLLNLPRSLLI